MKLQNDTKELYQNIRMALEGIETTKGRKREDHFQTLLSISETAPEALYEEWDAIVSLLRRDAVFFLHFGIHIIANIVSIDTEDRFDKIFDLYCSLLDHESPVVSPHAAIGLAKIVRAKPHLESKITQRLLKIDSTSKCKQLELMKAYVIDAFDSYFDMIRQKKPIFDFVRKQKDSESPKTRKCAQQFLDKWSLE